MGFTLIELMITVVLIGVLAAVAIAGYSAYIMKSRNTEATAVLSDIRLKQEAYRGTFQQYANISPYCGWTPPGPPDREPKTGWLDTLNADCKRAWRQLGAMPPEGTYFIFTVQAGAPGGAGPDGPPVQEYQDHGVKWTSDFWYGATAVQDLDGDSVCEGFVTVSGVMKIHERPGAAWPF